MQNPLLKVHLRDVRAALAAIEADFLSIRVGLLAGFDAGGTLGDDGEHTATIGFKLTGGVLARAAVVDTSTADLIEAAHDIATCVNWPGSQRWRG